MVHHAHCRAPFYRLLVSVCLDDAMRTVSPFQVRTVSPSQVRTVSPSQALHGVGMYKDAAVSAAELLGGATPRTGWPSNPEDEFFTAGKPATRDELEFCRTS